MRHTVRTEIPDTDPASLVRFALDQALEAQDAAVELAARVSRMGDSPGLVAVHEASTFADDALEALLAARASFMRAAVDAANDLDDRQRLRLVDALESVGLAEVVPLRPDMEGAATP